jgi:hypothetical protein
MALEILGNRVGGTRMREDEIIDLEALTGIDVPSS